MQVQARLLPLSGSLIFKKAQLRFLHSHFPTLGIDRLYSSNGFVRSFLSQFSVGGDVVAQSNCRSDD